MSAQEKISIYNFAEYLALEQQENKRYEFFQGEVFAMSGGTKRHNAIAINTGIIIRQQKPECETFINDVKLELQLESHYVYPDIMLTCHAQDLANDRESVVRYPSLVAEVLSDSTAAYDANTKKNKYLTLASLQYYLLISQSEARVEVYERQQSFWKYRAYSKLNEEVVLKSLNISFRVADIYHKIQFEQDSPH